ncbi:hypothetical protein [Pleionea sp. CnH1-48]|uniref:hypothetical protein n=1 Tax=Pleionea sp. CnH1-48 TaxID=2954494 RepID=UPI00209863F6|nr:hypothetical protein [Pleionea sp. CnH1-48]MCO7222981.1 hypothetical protein [Pleionea sp. CnH1-48]
MKGFIDNSDALTQDPEAFEYYFKLVEQDKGGDYSERELWDYFRANCEMITDLNYQRLPG